jgi:hypothetical protein
MHFLIFRSAAVPLAIACMSIASCASELPYNPDHLAASEVSRVGEICQGVMGLRPSKVLTENLWPGDPDLALETNDYRGCIATLSNSLETATAVREDSEAGSSSKRAQLASLGVMPFVEHTTTPSPDSVSARLPREQRACAEIGLDPNQRAFENCVQGLRNVMSASSMAENYRN